MLCDNSSGDEPVLKKTELTKKPKTNDDQKLIQAADEKRAPCTSWLPGLGWYRSAVTSSACISRRKEGILLEKKRLGQQKMHNLELGWLGHWSVCCSCACLPTSSDSSSCSLGCATSPSSLGLWICKALNSVPSGKTAAMEAVTHRLSRGSSFALSSFLSLCALCRKKRDTSWLEMGRDCLPDKKTSRCLNVHTGQGLSLVKSQSSLTAEEMAPGSLCSEKMKYKNKPRRHKKNY